MARRIEKFTSYYKIEKHVFYIPIDTKRFYPDAYDPNEWLKAPKPESYWIPLPLEFTGSLRFFSQGKIIKASITSNVWILEPPSEYEQLRNLFFDIGRNYFENLFKDCLWTGEWLEDQIESLHLLCKSRCKYKEKEYLIEEF